MARHYGGNGILSNDGLLERPRNRSEIRRLGYSVEVCVVLRNRFGVQGGTSTKKRACHNTRQHRLGKEAKPNTQMKIVALIEVSSSFLAPWNYLCSISGSSTKSRDDMDTNHESTSPTAPPPPSPHPIPPILVHQYLSPVCLARRGMCVFC